MGFQEAVKKCLSNFVNFTGRARRPEYWWFALFLVAGNIVFGLLDRVLFGTSASGETVGVLGALFGIAMLLPAIAVAVRRLHDKDMSGWWYLLVLIPFIGWLILLFFFVQKGTDGPNRFGEEPPA